jgi:hypothetical protein
MDEDGVLNVWNAKHLNANRAAKHAVMQPMAKQIPRQGERVWWGSGHVPFGGVVWTASVMDPPQPTASASMSVTTSITAGLAAASAGKAPPEIRQCSRP